MTKTSDIELFTVPCLPDNYAYLFHNAATAETAFIDAPEAAPIRAALDARGWVLTDILIDEKLAVRLVGFRTGDIVWFPVVQALFTAVLGWALAVTIFMATAWVINSMMAGQMEAGQLVSDDIVIAILRDRLADADCAKGVILDGFPRTTVQAEALDALLAESGQKINAAISLDVEDAAMVTRISGRYTCDACGEGYHDEFKQPAKDGVCVASSGSC